MRDLAKRSKQPVVPSLGGLISRWREFVRRVELGYDLSIYDYENELAVRDSLQTIVEAAPVTARAKIIDQAVQPDERFRMATRELSKPLLPGKRDWWWLRVPLRPGEELEDDLKSQHLTD